MAVFTKRILTLSVMLFTLIPLLSPAEENTLLPEEEAPAAFVDAVMGTDEVKLFLTGSWKADISAQGGFGWSAESGFNSDASYPGMETGFTFVQTPDFTAYLSILDRYLFEAAFTDDFKDSTFRLGYKGLPGEFLQTVSAGNMGINISDAAGTSDYFYIPDGGSSSFGLFSSFDGGESDHELLLRFDPDKEQKKVFIGTDSVTELELEVSDYLRKRFYYLPGVPQAVDFYTETSSSEASAITSGTGASVRYFSKLSSDKYSYSTVTGLLYLQDKPDGMLIASSSDLSWSESLQNSYAPLPLSDFQITTSAGPMLRLSDGGDITIASSPGEFSPFESAAAYNTSTVLPADSWKTRVYLAPDPASVSTGIELDTSIMNDEGIVIVNPAGSGTRQYPLQGLTSNLSSVYGPEAVTASGNNYLSLIIVIRETETSYMIDDPVPGTVRIFIDGRENFNWSLSGNTISFDVPPGAEDRIEITYRKKNSGDTGGDLLFASLNRFNLGSGMNAAFNAGFRWNIFSGAYAFPSEEIPGYLNAETSFKYDNSEDDADFNITAALSAGLRVQTDNSAGTLVLKNMSGDSLRLTVNRNTVFPSSPSASLGLESADRGLLIFKDYRISTSSLTDYLQDYDALIDSSLVFSPDQSTAAAPYKAGPYTAAARGDGISGEVLVMDYILPGTDAWTGVQIPVAPGSANTDLSGYSAISFDCKSEGDLSGVEFHLEIGAASEDLDGDGVLDAEAGKYSNGFIFNDINAAGGTLAGGDSRGGGNNILDTEDFNGNGFIDTEKDDAIALFSSGTDFTIPGSSWNRVRLYFNSSPASAAARLRNAEFVRITAVNTAGGQKSGRILIDDIRFEGSSLFPGSGAGFTAPSSSEIDESLISPAEKPQSLLDYPYRAADQENRVMRVLWSDPWQLYSILSPVKYDDYGSIIFYIHSPSLSNPPENTSNLNFRMLDPGGSGIKAVIPFGATSSWQKVEIRPSSGEIYIDDSLSGSAVLTVDTDAGSLVRLELEVDDASSGKLFIDELSLQNPALNTTAGLAADFSFSSKNAVITAGDFEIIGPLNFEENLSFTIVEEDQAVSNLNLYTSLATKIIGIDTKADLSWNDITGAGRLSASHEIKVPIIGSYLSVTDSFKTANAAGGDFTKTDNLDIAAGPVSGRIAGFTAVCDTGLLTQKWNSQLKADFAPLSITMVADMLLSGSGYSSSWSNYFEGWSTALLLAGKFDNSSLKERKSSFELSPVFDADPIGVKADLSLATGYSDNSYFNKAGLELGLPVSFTIDNSEISAELGYIRKAEYNDSTSGSGDFATDISGMFTLLSGRNYLYSSIPIAEIFTDEIKNEFSADCLAAGIDEAVFTNDLKLSFSRDYSSRLIDLFLPHSLSIGLGRKLSRDFTQTEDELDFKLSCRTAAMNLFGAAGAYSAFDFYFSDELNWSVDAVISKPTDAQIVQEYFIKGGLSIFGLEEQTLAIDNDLYLPFNKTDAIWSLKSSLLYIWNVIPEIPFDLPLFTAEEEELQIFTNEEKLTFSFTDTFSTEIKHITSLIIPETLTLSAFGAIGFQINALSETNIYLFGFSTGISASIFY